MISLKFASLHKPLSVVVAGGLNLLYTVADTFQGRAVLGFMTDSLCITASTTTTGATRAQWTAAMNHVFADKLLTLKITVAGQGGEAS